MEVKSLREEMEDLHMDELQHDIWVATLRGIAFPLRSRLIREFSWGAQHLYNNSISALWRGNHGEGGQADSSSREGDGGIP
jgi:hypothetical protein